MIKELVSRDHPALVMIAEPFDFKNPPTNPMQLAVDLAETMIQNNGLGLAANQIGLPYRAFAINANPVFVCFNPRIVDQTTETIAMDEGCLTFPNLFLKIKRSRTIKIRFATPTGEVMTRTFDGMTARCFQHELDHLNGVVYTSKSKPLSLSMAMKRRSKSKQRYYNVISRN